MVMFAAMHFEADILPRLEGCQWAPINRLQVERDEILCLLRPPCHLERAKASPTSILLDLSEVNVLLYGDEHISNDVVYQQPRLQCLSSQRAYDLLNCLGEMMADNRVIFRTNIQAAMFVSYTFENGRNRLQMIDIGGGGIDCRCQCLLLLAFALVGVVEDVQKFRV